LNTLKQANILVQEITISVNGEKNYLKKIPHSGNVFTETEILSIPLFPFLSFLGPIFPYAYVMTSCHTDMIRNVWIDQKGHDWSRQLTIYMGIYLGT